MQVPISDILKAVPWSMLNDAARATVTPSAARRALFDPARCRTGSYASGLAHPTYTSSPYGDEYACDREARESLSLLFPGVQVAAVDGALVAPPPGHVTFVAGSPKSSPAHAKVSAGEGGVLRIQRTGMPDAVLRSNLTFTTNPAKEVTSWMPGPRYAEQWTESVQSVVTRSGREYAAHRDSKGVLRRDYSVVRVVLLEFAGQIVFFAGGHLAGTRACGDVGQWLRGVGLIRCLRAQRASTTGSWEALLEVDEIGADAVVGSRGRRITVIAAWPMERPATDSSDAA